MGEIDVKREFPTDVILEQAIAMNASSQWQMAEVLISKFMSDAEVMDSSSSVRLLCERGLSYRMMSEPRRYLDAKGDFELALSLSRESGDEDGELLALTGLLDLMRIGDRDSAFNELYPEREEEARNYADDIAAVLYEQEEPSIAGVKASAEVLYFLNTRKEVDEETVDIWKRKTQSLVEVMDNNDSLKSHEKAVLARAWGFIGSVYERREELSRAEQVYGYVRKIMSLEKDRRGFSNACISESRVLEKRGDKTEGLSGINMFKKAKKLLDSAWQRNMDMESGEPLDGEIERIIFERYQRLFDKVLDRIV